MAESPGCGQSRALLISPHPHVSAELKALLAHELPLTAVSALTAYPGRARLLELGPATQFCFLDVTSDQAGAFAVMSTIAACCPNLAVIALLHNNDPDLILQCLRQGAAEFLIQPFTPDQLKAALDKLRRLHPSTAAAPATGGGRVYGVMPAKGACGATTIACNLAFALKRSRDQRVFLADLDGLTGTLPFLLKLKSNYSFIDALRHSGSLDADLWKALITPCHGVHILLSPESPVDSIGETFDPLPLVAYARQNYDFIVLDLGGPYGDWNLAAARLCDELLLATTNELASLYATQRVLLHLENREIDTGRIRILVNRFRPDMGLKRDGIETALRREIFLTLPSDYQGIARALMEGKPAQPGSDFGKSIAALAGRLAGEDERQDRKGSLLGSLFSRLK